MFLKTWLSRRADEAPTKWRWRIFGLEAFKERNLKDKAIRPTVCSFLSTELSERFWQIIGFSVGI